MPGQPTTPPSTSSTTILLHVAPPPHYEAQSVLRTPRLLRWEWRSSQNKERAVFTPHP